jgi:GntR family transcriptional regulator
MPAEPRRARSSRCRDIAAKVRDQARKLSGRRVVADRDRTDGTPCRQTAREALDPDGSGPTARRGDVGSAVIATEPPVLFTHSVRSLAEYRRFPNGTYRDVVASREIIANRKLAGTVEMRAGQALVLIEALRAPINSRPPQLDPNPSAAQIRWHGEALRSRPHAGARTGRKNVRSDHGTCPDGDFRARHAGDIGRGASARGGVADADCDTALCGGQDELFEVTVTTHPEGRYTYKGDMQRSLRPRSRGDIANVNADRIR